MTESNSKSITVSVGSDGNLIDPAISKREDIEHEYTEIIESLKEREEKLDKVLDELQSVTIAAQNPDFYKALAMLVKSSAGLTRELTLATKMKAEQIDKSIAPDASAATPQTINNNVFMTTTDMIDHIKGTKVIESSDDDT